MLQLLRNMGFRYVWFRIMYELRRRTGLLKASFPLHPPHRSWLTLSEWKSQTVRFFFESKEDLIAKTNEPIFNNFRANNALKTQIAQYRQGNFLFFSAKYYPVSDWLTNPSNGYRYDITKHWTEIADLSAAAGDIKYVWEKSRFAFLYPLLRHDFWHQENMAETVFAEIDSWIEANPVNQGPNWRCSQEISLRVLNWTFALHYYKNSPALTERRFARMMHLIYWQMRHVESNIDFSRIAVRNNHAITETLALYLVGLLYPFFPESPRWKSRGKQWFEEEIAYQIYEDGTFLQFSMNYHRVVIQLLTWGLRLAHLNGEKFAEIVYDRVRKSLTFLQSCQDHNTGWLPNYGNNDGALFFPLSDAHYRDYRPQLGALATAMADIDPSKETVYNVSKHSFEDNFWYQLPLAKRTNVGLSLSPSPSPMWRGVLKVPPRIGEGFRERLKPANVHSALPFGTPKLQEKTRSKVYSFDKGGYYVLRESDTLTFLRCGGYRDRPFQADNLHLDIWVAGQNIMCDAGSYLYNTDEQWTRYFAGTASHNTVMLDTHDQMRKGPRFIWYDWVKKAAGHWQEIGGNWQFEGQIVAFAHIGKNIVHRRRVTKSRGELRWLVEDWLENAPDNLPMHQIWHPSEAFFQGFSLRAYDSQEQELTVAVTEGWYSSLYGQKELTKRLIFSTPTRYIRTEIIGEN